MGHDISGYRTTDKEHNEEVAYLRRGAFNELNIEIYNALEAHDCNGGVSGNGCEKIFTKEQLQKALEYLKDKEELEPERAFVLDCLNNVDEKGEIVIGFY